MIAYAKANPGALNLASSGVGSTLHVAGELFKMMAGVNIVHVPYRGGAPAMIDLIGGRVQVMFDNVPTSLSNTSRSGKIRPLAVTSAARIDAAAGICRTVADYVPGYEASAWYGIVGAERHARRDRREAQPRGQRDPGRTREKARLAELGASLLPGSPADFGKLVADETEKWGKVIRFAGIKAE